MEKKYYCPVCGYDDFDRPPYDGGSTSHDLCSSCGFEYGYDDFEKGFSFDEWREQWIASGMKWYNSAGRNPPKNWDPKKQLENAKKSDLSGYDYEFLQEVKRDILNEKAK